MLLNRLYIDSAEIIRRSYDQSGCFVDKVIYSAQKCHLSVQRGLGAKASSAFKQTEAEARAAKSYVVYFPPECDIKAGDLLKISHCGRVQTGRAGDPMYGQLGVRVALDSSLVL